MKTREKILALLSKSKKPLGPKAIAFELKKTSANIRKILSNLHREGKITRFAYGRYKLRYKLSVNASDKSVNVSGESVNIEAPEAKKMIYKEIYKYQKVYLQRLKVNDPEAFEKIRSARNRYLKNWRSDHPDYNRKWLADYYRKHPEKFREYTRKYWLKKALSQK